jgi:hypothetical protein
MNIPGDERAEILRHVSRMLDPADRQRAGHVIEASGPFLDWTAEAADDEDRSLRMKAIRQARSNLAEAANDADYRRSAAPVPLSPERLLREARAYYGFIADAAAV